MGREGSHYSPMGSQRVGHNLVTKQQQNSFLNVFLKSLCIRILHAQIHWNHRFQLQRFSCCQTQMLFSTCYSIFIIIWHCYTLFFLKGFFSLFPGITPPWFSSFHTHHSFSRVRVNSMITFLLLLFKIPSLFLYGIYIWNSIAFSIYFKIVRKYTSIASVLLIFKRRFIIVISVVKAEFI